MNDNFPPSPPARLAVANIHPDYIDTCFELCSTGTGNNCRLPPGTVLFVRKTAGGTAKKTYGVVGVWYFTGRNEPVPRRKFYWPYRWDNRVVCKPVSDRFEEAWCEDFSIKTSEKSQAPKESRHVAGLVSTKLQGTIVTVKDPVVAKRYVEAIIQARSSELKAKIDYSGRATNGLELLKELIEALDATAGR